MEERMTLIQPTETSSTAHTPGACRRRLGSCPRWSCARLRRADTQSMPGDLEACRGAPNRVRPRSAVRNGTSQKHPS